MRIVFAGTPEFAATHLEALLTQPNLKDMGAEVVAVYTQPDRPAGRGRKLTPSPVKNLALAHQLPVFQPLSLKDEQAQQELRDLKPDLMIVVAYGLLLPQAVLEIPTHGCINVHGSLLPRWRGAAPIQRALLSGDATTGVTLMQMDIGLDTGAMLSKTETPITEQDTSASLYQRLAEQGAAALLALLPVIAQGQLQPEIQDEQQATYAKKLTKEEAQLDWRRSATELDRAVRGYQPWPVAWTLDLEQVIRIWSASALDLEHNAPPGLLLDIEDKEALIVACKEGCLRITELQLPGQKRMAVRDILNGHAERFQAQLTCFQSPEEHNA
ncbi:methionyl-tRNA formyltransferase [Marinospirillum sp. MEB164]|uniref:Methionyl-tRNA formyltransferase n=1 Tax=Marinospirillum alkalitolerans TaxID=3123374 RepID=A0ABW8PY14_9GAMM